MKTKTETFVSDVAGTRLDQFLALKLPRYSRGHAQILIAQGAVTVDGVQRSPDHRLKDGARVAVNLGGSDWSGKDEFESMVIFEDKNMLVLLKPAGLLMHPLGDSWLKAPEAALAEVAPNLAGLLQKARPEILRAKTPRCGIVHRLDRQTSGVLLAAKTPKAYESLVEQFKEREIQKLYRAIVRGVPDDRLTKVDAPIGRLPGHRKITVSPFGKAAETSFKVVASCKSAAIVEARPLTGRTHQIRAHLGHLGHPVMGDEEFDTPRLRAPWPPRLMLHAHQIQFTHPQTGKPAEFRAEPPKDFRDFWALCRARI